MKMHFETELELYEEVATRLHLTEKPTIDVIERGGATLHLVGERHGSLEPIAYIHEILVPKI